MSRIVVREAAPHEQERILQIALSESWAQVGQAQRACQMTKGYLDRCGGTIGGLYLAESAGQILTACAALDLPGGLSLLMVPAWSLAQSSVEILEDVLAKASSGVQRRGRRFAQILLETELAGRLRPQLLGVGFTFLANLQYMQRNAFDPVAVRPVDGVTWRTFDWVDEQAFADVIRRTYIDSRDCPDLTGIRTMPEVLAGHKGAGEFDPAGWYLLGHQGADVGVMVTVRTPYRPSLEIVYCGLVSEARGKGLGRICVHKAIMRARDLALPLITLAVDAANDPARRMYEAMGFTSYSSRDVWIKVFYRADTEGAFEWPKR